MNQTKHVIIVKVLVTWFIHVLWRMTKLIIWLGSQKKAHEGPKKVWVPKTSSWKWLLDSVCSRHMTGDTSLLSSITKINRGKVISGDNSKGKIIKVDNIGDKSSPSIEKVFLVNSLKYNLLSISQLCDKKLENYVWPYMLILENDIKFYLMVIEKEMKKLTRGQ